MDEFSASARMNQYEVGKRSPDLLTLQHIAKALKCPVAFFYAEDDALAEMILEFSRLSKEKKKKALELLRNL